MDSWFHVLSYIPLEQLAPQRKRVKERHSQVHSFIAWIQIVVSFLVLLLTFIDSS